MASRPLYQSSSSELADQDLIKARFLDVNQERLGRVHAALRQRQKDFLELLPLLFHINHPGLPGYCPGTIPRGISNYTPDVESLNAAKRQIKSFTMPRRLRPRADLLAIYMMGSTGTIAQSSDSDFDIWICYRPNLGEEQLQGLHRKANAVQHWAATLGLETHFFVLNDEEFRSGSRRQLSAESSGSVQHHLLLEEFYRTGLLVAGRFPIWWLVPPEQESSYDEYVASLHLQHTSLNNQSLNFGGLNKLSAGEFFGGALWQLGKAVQSPHKSLLKILLMEAYASEYPDVELLSLRFKKAIYDCAATADQLDPYVLMCAKVEEYLSQNNEFERIELARRCFYFKVDECLSQNNDLGSAGWRRTALQRLVSRWHWTETELQNLDARKTWKIHRLLTERKSMVDALTRSYHTLSRFARENAGDAAIDPADLNLLGRKLFTAFERKAGKIDLVNFGISTDLTESILSLHRIDKPGQAGWVLYRGDVMVRDAGQHTPIKQAHYLLELLAWCHLNELIHPVTTTFHYYPPYAGIDTVQLRGVLDKLRKIFPDARLPDTRMDDLSRPARVLKGGLFINIGVDPLSRLTRYGKHLLTDRIDAFHYGGSGTNLALNFDMILVSSWKEVLTFNYNGESAVLDCICDYLAWSRIDSGHLPPTIPCFSFSSTRARAIGQRVQKLFQDLIDLFYRDPRRHHARYILQVAQYYYVLQPENGVPRYQRFGCETDLLNYLGSPQPEFSSVFVDKLSLSGSPLPLVFSSNRNNEIQFFHEMSDGFAKIYILDERGSLHYEELQIDNKAALLSHMSRFLEHAQQRMNLLGHANDPDKQLKTITYDELKRDKHGRYTLFPVTILPGTDHPEFFEIQVIGDVLDGNNTAFTIYVDQHEFTTLEFGGQLFEAVANYVLERRASSEAYPVYITDIDLSRALLGTEGVKTLQTVHLLKYKQHIETQLNKALQASSLHSSSSSLRGTK